MSRFDYVKYDATARAVQEGIKHAFQHAETMISQLSDGRAKSIALTKLEEAYMWCGKGIRDDQIARDAATQLQEDRDPEPKPEEPSA